MPPKPKRLRLDLALVERGLAPTRSRAQSLIMAGRVLVSGSCVDKPGATVAGDDELRVDQPEHPWVGRGGIKLAEALERFGIDPAGRVCADVGASTGGFTDVLLQRGAACVYAIDVGYGQLDQKLREDPRVIVREKTNARFLEPEHFERRPDLITIDVSFISLRLILPPIARILAPGGDLIALIKPQFEVGRGEVGKGGIVRNAEARDRAIREVVAFAAETGFERPVTIESPIRGAEGNLEALMHARSPARRDDRG
ncbi:MAG TPA: TlyA family RNA methyltransferase [Thermoanaerobaculia bacterium]|nr:TlyA family RNA methyltransferase [Thermoanaerobaculia bacterium]